jgi:hypothetical protein
MAMRLVDEVVDPPHRRQFNKTIEKHLPNNGYGRVSPLTSWRITLLTQHNPAEVGLQFYLSVYERGGAPAPKRQPMMSLPG